MKLWAPPNTIAEQMRYLGLSVLKNEGTICHFDTPTPDSLRESIQREARRIGRMRKTPLLDYQLAQSVDIMMQLMAKLREITKGQEA